MCVVLWWNIELESMWITSWLSQCMVIGMLISISKFLRRPLIHTISLVSSRMSLYLLNLSVFWFQMSIVRHSCGVARHLSTTSTTSSSVLDRPLFSKTSINFNPTVWSTSNQWHWKVNSILYFVSKYELNFTVRSLPSITKFLMYLRSSASQIALKSLKLSKTYMKLKRL